MDLRLASLEHDARQPRPPMDTDVQVDKKTRERTEGAATADQATHGDRFSANRVDLDLMCSTMFGVEPDSPALLCRDDVSVENGAAVPKSYILLLEMRTTTVAGGLLPTGETSTAPRTTFDHPTLWFCLTEKTNLMISTLYAWHYSIVYLRAAPCCRRVIKTKSGQNRMLNLCGSKGRLRACPFLETWRALPCGEVHVRVE